MKMLLEQDHMYYPRPLCDVIEQFQAILASVAEKDRHKVMLDLKSVSDYEDCHYPEIKIYLRESRYE